MCACFVSLFRMSWQVTKSSQSLIVTNSNARRLKFSCLYSSHIRTPSSPRAIRVLRPMVLGTHQCHFRAALTRDKHCELSFHAEPWYVMFLASKSNSGYVLSIFLLCDPSAGCLNIESFLRSCLWDRINIALSLFLNRCFKRGIIGEYHMTFAGTLFQGRLPLDISRIIFSNLVTQCIAYGTCIQILVLASVEDVLVGACMYLLHFLS